MRKVKFLWVLRVASRRPWPCRVSLWPAFCARYWPGTGAAAFLLVRALVAWWVPLSTFFLCCGRGLAVRLPQAPVGPLPRARVSLAAVVSCEGIHALDAGGFPGAHPSVCRGGMRVALRW